MKTKSIFIKMFLLLFFTVIICEDAFSQKGKKYSCPLYKGKILISSKASQEWGTKIAQVEIKSRRQEVYSSSLGTIIAVDTTFDKKINIAVQDADYIFVYDNLLSTKSLVGQKVEKGHILGKLKAGDYLLVRIKNGIDYIDPKEILPCKVVKVNK